MGMGRNSSRLASRRLATSSKAGTDDDNEAPGDEDWIEPGPAAGEWVGGRARAEDYTLHCQLYLNVLFFKNLFWLRLES